MDGESEGGLLLQSLGRAVRARREALGTTLRALSVDAGVSQRFLVQVESGTGNISVVRLSSLARALGSDAAWLLADAQRRMKRASEQPARAMVALLGLRGAGKTTVGKRLAEKLQVPFFELDEMVERAAAMPLATLFELHGSAYFRKLERQVLMDLLVRTPHGVLATGGGIVTDVESYEALRRRTITVWLRARPEDHLARVIAQGDLRPMAGHNDALEDIRKLLLARGPLYEQAEHCVETSGLRVAQVVKRVEAVARDSGLVQGLTR